MPWKEPAESMLPSKNARFSGRLLRCTLLSSSRVSSWVQPNAWATTPAWVRGSSRSRRLPSSRPCTRPLTICGWALAKPLLTTRISATTSRLRLDTSIFAAPADSATAWSVRGDQPTLAGQFSDIGIAGDKGILVEHQAQLVGPRTRLEVAQHLDRHAGLAGQVADKELAFVELGGCEHLALELVDAGDAAVHHHLVGPAGEGDLRRHRDLELTAEHRQHVGGGGHSGHLTVVQRRPLLALALAQAQLEAVLLGEEGIGVGR